MLDGFSNETSSTSDEDDSRHGRRLNSHGDPCLSSLLTMDRQQIALDVYNLADSLDSLAQLVKKSLGVIEQCLETYG